MTLRIPLVLIGGIPAQLPAGDSIQTGGVTAVEPIIASFAGSLVTSVGTSRYYAPFNTTLSKVYASLGVASSSGAVAADVLVNGSVVATVSIAQGANLSANIAISVALLTSDYVTINLTGAGAGASDLTIFIVANATVTYSSQNLDGGSASSVYGGIASLDGGGA